MYSTSLQNPNSILVSLPSFLPGIERDHLIRGGHYEPHAKAASLCDCSGNGACGVWWCFISRGDIISEWANVKPPPVPELKPAVVDGKTTALLILDLMKANCGQRPRCLATVPNVKKLHDEARAAGMMVFYTLVGGPNPTPADVVDPGIAPREGEWVVQRGPDKFLGSPLEEGLKA